MELGATDLRPDHRVHAMHSLALENGSALQTEPPADPPIFSRVALSAGERGGERGGSHGSCIRDEAHNDDALIDTIEGDLCAQAKGAPEEGLPGARGDHQEPASRVDLDVPWTSQELDDLFGPLPADFSVDSRVDLDSEFEDIFGELTPGDQSQAARATAHHGGPQGPAIDPVLRMNVETPRLLSTSPCTTAGEGLLTQSSGSPQAGAVRSCGTAALTPSVDGTVGTACGDLTQPALATLSPPPNMAASGAETSHSEAREARQGACPAAQPALLTGSDGRVPTACDEAADGSTDAVVTELPADMPIRSPSISTPSPDVSTEGDDWDRYWEDHILQILAPLARLRWSMHGGIDVAERILKVLFRHDEYTEEHMQLFSRHIVLTSMAFNEVLKFQAMRFEKALHIKENVLYYLRERQLDTSERELDTRFPYDAYVDRVVRAWVGPACAAPASSLDLPGRGEEEGGELAPSPADGPADELELSHADGPADELELEYNDPAELERARVRRELALAITALEHNALPPMLGQEMLVPQGVRDSPREVADLNPQRALRPTSTEHFAIGNSGWPSLNGKVWEKSQPSVINLVAHSALEACAHDDPTLFDPPSKHRLKVLRLLSTTDANALAHEDRTRFDPPFIKEKHKSMWTCDSEARVREDHARFDPPFKYRLRCA
jgi:hypothetical protein